MRRRIVERGSHVLSNTHSISEMLTISDMWGKRKSKAEELLSYSMNNSWNPEHISNFPVAQS